MSRNFVVPMPLFWLTGNIAFQVQEIRKFFTSENREKRRKENQRWNIKIKGYRE